MSTVVFIPRGRDPVRRLALIRHAKSDHPPGFIDHDRPLSERGSRDAQALGAWLTSTLGDPVEGSTAVIVSSAERTQQTWLTASSAAGSEWAALPTFVDGDIYEASPGTLRSVALRHGAAADLIVMVGHNPGIGLLARELAAPGAARATLADGFPTSAVAVLDTEEPWTTALAGTGGLRLSSFVTPRG